MVRATVDVESSAEAPVDAARRRWRQAGPVLVRVAAVAAVAVGVAARFASTSPMWLDEALSANIATLPLGELGDALRRDGHPPLYYWLLHGWSLVFGDGDGALRAMSGLVGVASLPLAWLAGRRLGGERTAWWSLVLVSLSPFAVRYATETRMYSVVMFLVLAGAVLLPRALERASAQGLVMVTIVTAGLLWTHYWSIYLVVSVGALLLVRWWRRPDERGSTVRVIGALGAGVALFLPWVPSLLDQLASTGTPWAPASRPTQAAAVALVDLGGAESSESALVGVLIAIAVVFGSFGRRSADGRLELQQAVVPAAVGLGAVTVLALGIGTAAGYLSGSAFASRYAAIVVPLVLLIAARGLAVLPKGWLRAGLASALVAFSLVGVVLTVAVDRTQAGELADLIVEGGGADDLVVVCPDQLGPGIERALRRADGPTRITPYPLGDDPRFIDWRDYEERNDAADPAAFAEAVLADAGDAVIWVVWSGTYRTMEGDCELLVATLGAARPATLVADNGDQFEVANLHRFG